MFCHGLHCLHIHTLSYCMKFCYKYVIHVTEFSAYGTVLTTLFKIPRFGDSILSLSQTYWARSEDVCTPLSLNFFITLSTQ
jgi:hypothetical protein